MKLQGNTILITGGGSGIGFEMAKELVKLGNVVIISGRSAQKLAQAQKRCPELKAIVSDVSQPDAIRALYEQVTRDFPKLNILVNNAGIMREISLHVEAESLEDLTREIDTNLNGPIRMSKQFLPHLKKQSTAAIVNVSSGLAFVPLPISPVYCATKAALHSFTQSLRVQLKKTNVKVFELAPPATKTELLDAANPEDMKGISIMSVEAMVAAALSGMAADKFEIRPGQSNQLKFMSRLAPEFILAQLSKSAERRLAN